MYTRNGYKGYKGLIMAKRVIKFRVWDITNECFLPSYANNGELFKYKEKFTGIDWFLSCARLEKPNRFEVQQFTGLKDKNGKEIYEGDLVKFLPWPNEKVIKEIIFKEGTFTYEDTFYDYEGLFYTEVCEVVGNVFENPDLI